MIRLLTTAALSLAGFAASAAEKFPAHPLSGTFELESTTPDIAAVDPHQLQAEIFQTGQRVRFAFKEEYGADRADREVYEVTLLPPFDRGFCARPRWSLSCSEADAGRAPAAPLKYDAYLDAERLKTAADVNLYAHFAPYGLKPGGFVYTLTYADSSASYVFYLKDWDTLISRSAYDAGDKVVQVDQVLKRVKTP